MESEGRIYRIRKKNIASFNCPGENVEASADSPYHEVVQLGVYAS